MPANPARARKIHAKSPQIPVIIVTGYGPVDGGRDVSACLQKEDMFPALLEKIKLFLGESSSPPKVEVVKKKKAGKHFAGSALAAQAKASMAFCSPS